MSITYKNYSISLTMDIKRLLTLFLAPAAIAAILGGCTGKKEASLEMLSRDYTFPIKGTPLDIPYGRWEPQFNESTAKSFTLTFNVPANTHINEQLVDIDGIISVVTTAGTGNCANVTAVLQLTDSVTGETPRERRLNISAPLGEPSDTLRTVVVNYTGNTFSIYVDGHLYDNDFPIGTPATGRRVAEVFSQNVKDVQFYTPALTAVREVTTTADIPQYWTPPYDNAWVGDVVATYFNGRYHVFYLFDRRGHKSKFGNGGHYFEHLSTPDLVAWTEHEAAVPIDEQWETLGTGTPFVSNGELCLGYGLHTTRLFPYELTTLPAMKAVYDSLGSTVCISYDTVTGFIPAGATYAVSHDGGLTFEKSRKLFHFCENPSVYNDSTGAFMMLANYGARGTWQSDTPDEGWHCINTDFPPGGDCTFPFSVGNRDYIIGGFTGLWSKPTGAPATEFTDMVKEGKDCYNGLSVPAVTTLPDGRTLMSGWLKMKNWGGALVTHEIIPDGNDGALGSRWVEELIPNLPEVTLKAGEPVATPSSFICNFTLMPEKAGNGNATLSFGDGTIWTINLDSDRAWFASSADDTPRTLAEGGNLAEARDYAITARTAESKKIPVRVIVYSRPKFDGSIIDVEIDGRRTMLSYRPGLTVSDITFTGENIKLAR